jgi:hypothetical protein
MAEYAFSLVLGPIVLPDVNVPPIVRRAQDQQNVKAALEGLCAETGRTV